MSRFEEAGLRRFRARDAILVVVVAAVLLGLLAGPSVRKAGQEMNPGLGRDIVLGIGRPAASVSTRLALASFTRSATGFLSPDRNLGAGAGAFSARSVRATAQVPTVTPDAFDPAALGAPTPTRRRLRTLLVTGDSMAMPLDAELARRLVGDGVRVVRDPHVGTGISKSIIVDWGRLATTQVADHHPDAIVVFVGANEGFPMPDAAGRETQCCGPDWAAIYANRVRAMLDTYRQAGAARVYWITLPIPREAGRRPIATAVNAAIAVAAQPWADQVRVIDSVPIFTPSGYRDSMTIKGSPTIVREPDGIHLNQAGSSLLADVVLADLTRDFTR